MTEPVPFEKYSELQQQLQQEQERRRRFEGMVADVEHKLKKFDGIDPDEFSALKKELDDIKKDKAKGSAKDFDAWATEKEVEIRQAVQKEVDALKSKLESTSGENHELKVVERAMEQIGSKFNPDVQKYIKGIIRDRVSVDDEGNFFIKDKNGKPTYSTKDPSKALGLTDLAEQVAADHPSFVAAEYASGTKTNGTKTSAPINDGSFKRFLSATPEERASIPADERRAMTTQALKGMKFSSQQG